LLSVTEFIRSVVITMDYLFLQIGFTTIPVFPTVMDK